MEKIDILYIHPLGENPKFAQEYFKDKRNNEEHFFGFIPMGIIGVLNNLKKHGFKVRGVNLSLKKKVNPSFDLKKCLEYYDPEIVLIDMHWYVHIKDGLRVAKICKEFDCQVIAGGMSATFFYKQLPEDIDYIIKGDAEKPLLKLADAIINNKSKDIENVYSRDFDNEIEYRCSDIDDYDYVNIDFMEDKESYLNMFDFWLMTGKGCPFNCEKCDGNIHSTKSIFGRNRTIFRKHIVSDLKKMEADTAAFSLDISVMPEEIIERLSKEKFSLNLRNEFFQLPNIEKIKRIKDSFKSFDLVFSPDSGDDKERKEQGKNFSNEDFLDSLEKIKKLDIEGGIIVYFTDYLISPNKVREFDKAAREDLIEKIKRIFPLAMIEVLPRVVDPGSVDMDKERLFRIYQ